MDSKPFIDTVEIEMTQVTPENCVESLLQEDDDIAAVAARQGYSIPAFHGTSRADRVGNTFRKSRATSGPMAFFTDARDIAAKYSIGKQDTSLEMPEDYRDWFKIKAGRSEVNVTRAWNYLSREQQQLATQRLYTTGYANPDEASGAIVTNSQSIMPKSGVDYELQRAKGNALEAAKEIWLNSGELIDDEKQFIDVLKAMGINNARLDDPNAKQSKVYDVFLRIQNPFDTGKITPEQVATFEQAAKRQRKAPVQYGADAWDKRSREAQHWVTELKNDLAKGTNSYVWSSIPDWVSKIIKGWGYDGIKDTGGKMGGQGHTVWIPFHSNQIKSADPVTYYNNGKPVPIAARFNAAKNDIREFVESLLQEDSVRISESPDQEVLLGSTYYWKDSDSQTFLFFNGDLWYSRNPQDTHDVMFNKIIQGGFGIDSMHDIGSYSLEKFRETLQKTSSDMDRRRVFSCGRLWTRKNPCQLISFWPSVVDDEKIEDVIDTFGLDNPYVHLGNTDPFRWAERTGFKNTAKIDTKDYDLVYRLNHTIGDSVI